MSKWFFIINLVISGFILLLLDLFLIPGFGIIGIIGIVILGISCLLAFQLTLGLGILVVFLSIGIIFVIFIIFFKAKLWQKIKLETKKEKNKGFQNSNYLELEKFKDKEGKTLSCLRPTGFAEIEEKRIEVITEGEYLPQGTSVKVIRVEGNKVIVRKI